MTGRTDYLFKRPGSQNWHVKFHYPRPLHEHVGRQMVVHNLKTTDRKLAELKAAELLHQHRAKILEHMIWLNGEYRYGPWPIGEMKMHEGVKAVATPESVYFIKNDRIFMTVKNDDRAYRERVVKEEQPKPKPAAGDIEHIERWIAHKNVSPYLQKEAREAFRLFQELVPKPFKDCTRDDGRRLVTYLFEEKKNKSATVQKKVGHLCAAVNLAMSEGQLTFNPFSSIIPKVKDQTVREPLTDDDMAKLRRGDPAAGVQGFDAQEWLLLMLCATTGMRRGEAYSIDSERSENGIRYVIIGSKTDQSLRRVPLPDAVLPLLPAKITGPLFQKDLKNLGRETLRQMRKLGVEKDIHGLRHRAKDQLRAGGVPLDLQYELLGHEEKTVAAGYGHGSPMQRLKDAVEKIGF